MSSDIKIVVLGSGGVGKSALTIQFVNGIFAERYCPTIEDSYTTHFDVDGDRFFVEVLDTAGSEQFTAMRDLYIRNGHGFILVYSITAQSTYNELIDVYDQIVRIKGRSKDIPMVVVGNKCDLDRERVVAGNQGQNLANQFHCAFLEISAKNNDAIFKEVIRQIQKDEKIRAAIEKKKYSTICCRSCSIM